MKPLRPDLSQSLPRSSPVVIEGRALTTLRPGGDDPPGALLLFRADDKAHVAEFIEKDAFTPSGVIAETDIVEWEPVIGPLLPAILGDR
jgi:hypothetical protein